MLENMSVKTCNMCSVEKPIECFHKDKSKKDGISYRCKPCTMIRSKEWNTKNADRKLQLDKKFYYKNKAKYDEMTLSNHFSIEPAVYMIKNKVNGKIYIGTSKAPYRRIKQHLSYRTEGVEINTTQQLADEVLFYGKKSFISGVIEYTTKENKHECERKWIRHYQPQYNVRKYDN